MPTRNPALQRKWRAPLIVLLLAALPAGCGGGLCPVEGQVVWKDGSPAKELEGSQVVFDLPEKKTSARGVVRADGTFRLTTSKPDDGAFPGEHKVVILENRKNANPAGTLLMPAMLDPKYGEPKTSPLTATVKAGSPAVVLTVERAPGQGASRGKPRE